MSELIEKGVMVMKNGKGWGIVYEDGRSTEYGWMNPAKQAAKIHDPEFFHKPTDATYDGSHYISELRTAKLVHVERKTTVRIVGDEDG